MAFINANGLKISYECSELIEELKQDIEEFGGDTVVAVWCKEYAGVTIYTNYDFIEDEVSSNNYKVNDDEFLRPMTMTALLFLFEKQNEIL